MAFSNLPTKFDDIKVFINNKIVERYPRLQAFLNNSFLAIIIDLFAYAVELFMDYDANLFNERHLPTTTQFENARIKAKFFGYKAQRKRSATGTIRVGLNSDFDELPLENLTLNQYDGLTINGISYLVAETSILKTTDFFVDVPVIQGELIEISNTAQGDQDEFFDVEDDSIEETVFNTTVNSVAYTTVDSFFKSIETDLHYVIDALKDQSGVKIIFGDGFRGIQLSAGATIDFKYIKTLALEGQIKSVGFVVTFLETYTYTDTTVVDLYGENISKLESAAEDETLESIKFFGQLATSTMEDTAFVDPEIKVELKEFGGILISKALSEFDRSPDNPDFTLANIVELLIIMTTGLAPDTLTKQQIRLYLRERMDFTDFIQFTDVEQIGIRFVFDFEVFTNAPQNFADLVDDFVAVEYALSILDFGESIDHSQVSTKVSNEFPLLIKRFNLVLKVVELVLIPTIPTDSIISRTLLIGGLRTGLDNIKNCTITIVYNKGTGGSLTEILISNTGGGFDVSGGGSSDATDTSSINFQTGLVNLDMKLDVTDIVSLEYVYETYDKDGIDLNVDIKTNQIIKYDSSSSTIEILT